MPHYHEKKLLWSGNHLNRILHLYVHTLEGNEDGAGVGAGEDEDASHPLATASGVTTVDADLFTIINKAHNYLLER